MCEEYCDSGKKAEDDASLTYAAAVECVHTFHQYTLKYMGFDLSDAYLQHVIKCQFERIIEKLTAGPTEDDMLALAVNEATRDVMFEGFEDE